MENGRGETLPFLPLAPGGHPFWYLVEKPGRPVLVINQEELVPGPGHGDIEKPAFFLYIGGVSIGEFTLL
jgi:hypothetical protein